MITVKDNQPTLLNEAKEAFTKVEAKDLEGVEKYHESDCGHGRIEERTYYAVPVPKESTMRDTWSRL